MLYHMWTGVIKNEVYTQLLKYIKFTAPWTKHMGLPIYSPLLQAFLYIRFHNSNLLPHSQKLIFGFCNRMLNLSHGSFSFLVFAGPSDCEDFAVVCLACTRLCLTTQNMFSSLHRNLNSVPLIPFARRIASSGDTQQREARRFGWLLLLWQQRQCDD
jgi:hypothetical protein